MKKLRLVHDSRDKHFYQHFGQVIDFPSELDFDTAQVDDVQQIGDVRCTCYTTCDIAEDQENRAFDIQDLWSRIPRSQFGANPRDVLGEAVKNGLLPIGQTTRVKDWHSYWSAISGDKDYFDNARSALMLAKSPIGVATYWCAEWLNVPAYGVMPIGKTKMNGHMYSVEGWKTVNGEPMMIVEAWIGRKLYMPRAVFNQALSDYGCSAWVLSTNEIDEKIKLNILQKIKDVCINAIILLKQLLVVKSAPVQNPIPPEPQQVYNEVKEQLMDKKDLLTEFCTAISQYEGKPGDLNYRNNNPGNLRNVDGSFKKFKTWDEGMLALKDYVTRACTGKHKAYSPMFTLIDFFNVYAPSGDNNNPGAYAKWVANRIGVDVSFKIKNLVG